MNLMVNTDLYADEYLNCLHCFKWKQGDSLVNFASDFESNIIQNSVLLNEPKFFKIFGPADSPLTGGAPETPPPTRRSHILTHQTQKSSDATGWP